MMFADYEIEAGASVRLQRHENEEVWQLIKGVLEMVVGSERRRVLLPG